MDASDTKPPEEWSVDELIGWIEQKRRGLLTEDDRKKFEKFYISAEVFLNHGNKQLFIDCGLPLGKALTLAELSRGLAKERNIQQAGDADMVDAASLSCDNDKRLTINDVMKLVRLTKEETTAGDKRSIQQTGDADIADTAPKKPRLEDLEQLAQRAQNQRKLIRNKVKEVCKSSANLPFEGFLPPPDFVKQFSEPDFVATLPFPFVVEAFPDRFKINPKDAERNWPYMGREKFTTLVDQFEYLLKDDSKTRLIVYGTGGYGKSHLLAALVCLLAAGKTHVVYVPDCRELMNRPVRYMKAAMLFAWADDTNKQQVILTLNSLEVMDEFLDQQSRISNVVFVIDQLNALETEKNDNKKTINKKLGLRDWLGGLLSPASRGILSTSANNHKVLGQSTRQDSYRIMYAYGGLTKKEMKCWWAHKERVRLPDGGRYEVEDFTGRIPLFLDRCIVNGEINLYYSYFETISKQAARFELEIQEKCSPNDLRSHYQYMKACIYGRKTAELSHDIPNLVDLRYFYNEYDETRNSSVGRYSCGLAREAVAPFLLKNTLRFNDKDLLKALPKFIDNPSVAGFMIEQAVLASLALNGNSNIHGSPNSMVIKLFDEDVPSFNTNGNDPVLYIPRAFNFRYIDGIITVIEKVQGKPSKTSKLELFMYPFQITLRLESHLDSRVKFFEEWDAWTRTLDDFNVTPRFLWISPETKNPQSPSDSNPHSYRKTKELPAHSEQFISISSINEDIWESYEAWKQGWESEDKDFMNPVGMDLEESREQEASGAQEASGEHEVSGKQEVSANKSRGNKKSQENKKRPGLKKPQRNR